MAVEFYSVVADQEGLNYHFLLKKWKTSWYRELPESTQARFQTASQTGGESLADWADRV